VHEHAPLETHNLRTMLQEFRKASGNSYATAEADR
jgi:hypothetical protein